MANDTNQRLLKIFPGARLFAVAPAVLLLAAACGGSDDTTPKLDEVCEPGKAAECRCPSGQLSSQQCAPDGLKWGDCQCTAGVGGTANGGSAGSAAGGSAQGGAAGGGAGGNAGVGGAGAVSGNGGVGGSTAGSAGMGAGGTSAGSGGVGGTNTAGSSSGGSSGSAAGGTGGTGGSAAGGSSGTGGSGGSGPLCPGTHGPAMTKISSTLCVDNTEVTVAQYEQFLAAKSGDTSGQPSLCSWNDSYGGAPPNWAKANSPRTLVDWCDARAFCEWSGKRLCGPIGSQWMDDPPLPASHELGTVCLELFGNAQVDQQCDTYDVHDVGSVASCTGQPPNDQVMDVQGNVREWVGCRDENVCFTFGTYVLSNPTYYKCTSSGARETWRIDDMDAVVGFRCCADPN